MASAANDRVHPLTPATDQVFDHTDIGEETTLLSKKLRRRKYLKCCGCCFVAILLPVIVIIILIFTVFRVKDPKIMMNGVSITRIRLINGTTTPDPNVNITIVADVSVKNPNIASFKYNNSTTALYYRGNQVGEARVPLGRAKARRTQRMNVTVEMITARLISDPNVKNDVDSRVLTMSSYTRIGGRVKILRIITKHVTVKMNCTMTVNLTSVTIQAQKCKRKISL